MKTITKELPFIDLKIQLIANRTKYLISTIEIKKKMLKEAEKNMRTRKKQKNILKNETEKQSQK